MLKPPKTLQKLSFWRNLALYFMLFSFVGHWLEILSMLFIKHFLGKEPVYGIMNNYTEPYNIYGLGAVVCILVVTLLPRRITKNIPLQYLINTLVCAVVEYISGLIVIWRFGSNIFWDYSDRFMNLQGQICLENTLLFGIAATLFMEAIYPLLEKTLQKIPPRLLTAIFVIITILFLTFTIIYWK